MDDFEIKRLPTAPLVVYVVSTTGQGEEPDNMKKTWRSAGQQNLLRLVMI